VGGKIKLLFPAGLGQNCSKFSTKFNFSCFSIFLKGIKFEISRFHEFELNFET
jgi:hypothetical protein